MFWFLLLLAASGKRRARPRSTTAMPASAGRDALLAVAKTYGIAEPWISWLLWVAKGESDWRTSAHNGSPGERQASLDMITHMNSTGQWPICREQGCCAEDPHVLAIGSGGWFGQLAPLTAHYLEIAGAPMSLVCDPKAAWLDPPASLAAHFVQVGGVLQILRKKVPPGTGSFLQLRALYGRPTRDPGAVDTAQRRASYSATLRSAGLPPTFLDQIVPPTVPQVRPW